MCRFTFLVLIFFFALPANAGGEWTTADTQREMAWQIINAVDCVQTHTIAREPEIYTETNWVLGKNPSVGRVNTLCTLAALGHYGISRWLSTEVGYNNQNNRKLFQWATIGLSAKAVAVNYHIGIGLKW